MKNRNLFSPAVVCLALSCMPAARVMAADLQFGPSNQGHISFDTTTSTATYDLDGLTGAIIWRDNVVASPASAKNKMHLSSTNVLTLYKQNGSTTGITLDADNNKITLLGSSGGIYFGANTTPTITAGTGGKAVFGSGMDISSGQLTIASTTDANAAATTGALTVVGGIGVAKDSYINGLIVGKGPGNNSANTAVGVDVLRLNSTGFSNTGFGASVLKSNTGGYNNSGFGVNALTFNLSGGSNTATGSYSLYANSTGNCNTATGTSALQSNTYSFNSAFGDHSLYLNTSGLANSGVGANSLYQNTTGSYNSGLGYNSLYSNATGSNNAALGYSAGSYNTGGSNNVFVGISAGSFQANGSTSLTATSNSIYIGPNARGKDNSDSNSIVIGATAIGEGANTVVMGNATTQTSHFFGQVTLTNTPWKNRPGGTSALADPLAGDTDRDGNALVVEGHTVMKGKVTISEPQGDIPMFTGY